MMMSSIYDQRLVMLSIIVAVFASYTALTLAGRVTAAFGRSRLAWLIGGAIVMGVGIWSMHFVGMLAFSLPISIAYDVWIVVLSVLPAIIASGLALSLVSRRVLSIQGLLLGGLLMGIGIAGMHYIGMAAMQIKASIQYDPVLFVVSVAMAIGASIAALWIAFQLRTETSKTGWWRKCASALVMGAAIAGMHYTGMTAAIFKPTKDATAAATPGMNNSLTWLAVAIGITTLVILGFALITSFLDQRLTTQAQLIKQQEAVKDAFEKLNSVISQAHQVGTKITSSTTQIAAAGKHLEATVTGQASSTKEVSATVAEIAATSGELVKTMEDIAQKAQVTALATGNSQADLIAMATAMRQLAQGTTSISSRLRVMNEKANNINSVVTTITKVADMTNLLSLNAAIEAEKAGQYGVGFAVVAREIRQLADNTAVATQEIEQMVQEIQSSVSKGVMEMDKFSKEVSNHVERVGQIGGQIASVLEQVQSLTPQFEEVSHSVEQQFESAQHISSAIAQLDEASQQIVESLQETNQALNQLDDTAQVLKGIISSPVGS